MEAHAQCASIFFPEASQPVSPQLWRTQPSTSDCSPGLLTSLQDALSSSRKKKEERASTLFSVLASRGWPAAGRTGHHHRHERIRKGIRSQGL